MADIVRKMQFKDSFVISLLDQRYFHDFFRLQMAMINIIYDDRFSFVCESEGIIIGYILAVKKGNKTKVENEIDIISLCVDISYSKKGLGKLLLSTCINEIKRIEPRKQITLTVSKDNIKSQKLYSKFGFEIISEAKCAYFDGTDGYVMVRKPFF